VSETTEHPAKTPPSRTGPFATLCAFLRHPGSSAPPSTPRNHRLVVTSALVAAASLVLVLAAAPALAAGPPSVSIDTVNVTATTANVSGGVNPNGFETHWRFEFGTDRAKVEAGEGTVAEEGTIAAAEADEKLHSIEAELTGLSPNTTYYVRPFAENAKGNGSEAPHVFSTPGPPTATTFAVHALDGEAIRVLGSVQPNAGPVGEEQTVTIGGAPTGGTFALNFNGQTTGATATGATASGSDVVTLTPAATGTGTFTYTTYTVTGVTTATGALHPGQLISSPGLTGGARITAVSGSTLTLDSSARQSGTFQLTAYDPVPFVKGEAISGAGIPVGTTITEFDNTEGRLVLSQPATATNTAVTLTANLPFDATNEVVHQALEALSNISCCIQVAGPQKGGPYKLTFVSTMAGVNWPQITADASGLTPSGTGTVTVATTRDGFSYETHYHFEYVSQVQFEQSEHGGFAEAASTPEVPTGGGVHGADLPGLKAGETYHYRVVATNNTPGNPVAHADEQTLTVPTAAPEAQSPACENEVFRTGLSAHLPDCRAYEQVTPVDKGGAQDTFSYGQQDPAQGRVGEDGEHAMLAMNGLQWGSSPDPHRSNYFFSRTSSGWQMTGARPLGETGPFSYQPQLYSPDLTDLGVASSWQITSKLQSPETEFKAGPPGGPYVTVASVPVKQVGTSGGWVAASRDFAKLILQVEDHTLLGSPTGTTSGSDLYEYSAGELRRLNAGIGSCGARIVNGYEGYISAQGQQSGSPHAVSADGSRVFFEAVPGGSCSEPRHLYMRVNGEEIVDIGVRRFLGANAAGTRLLLQANSGGASELFLYDTEARTEKSLFSSITPINPGSGFVSEDFAALYFYSGERLTPEAPPLGENNEDVGNSPTNLYRYDLSSEALRFVAQAGSDQGFGGGFSASPDGRYFYFAASGVAGVAPAPRSKPEAIGSNQRVYRYDSTENVIQCMECASPFDPEPTERATFLPLGINLSADGVPNTTVSSANGDYVFFDTTTPLVLQDVNGEREAGTGTGDSLEEGGHDFSFSTSSDVYEWRRNGVDGCGHIQGCLSLISSGTGGERNMLLGTTASGRDVFFATHSQLVSQDNDSSGDVYDARIGGGFPPPPRAVECEAGACVSPLAAPVDTTPASLSFSGPGNPAQPVAAPKPAAKARVKPCRRGSVRKHGRCVKRRRAKKAARRAVNHGRGGGR
jgi:hypothetical protein